MIKINLPNFIGDFKWLEELDLEDNQLTSLPETLKNLERLTFIDIGGNNMKLEQLNDIIDNWFSDKVDVWCN